MSSVYTMAGRAMPCDQVIALVLAAGSSRRFGGDKRMARLADGRGLLESTLVAVAAVFKRVYVVLRAEDSPAALGVPPGVGVIRATHATRGMGASLAQAVAELADSEAKALAVFLGDMPWIGATTQRYLCTRVNRSIIIRPHYRRCSGHPVLFGRDFWPALRKLDGDSGARELLREQHASCVSVDVEDPGIHQDIDTPDDLRLTASRVIF
nr:nucleotidyltransferase family protein [Pseudomonas mendocina]